jgi:hypothetical protein
VSLPYDPERLTGTNDLSRSDYERGGPMSTPASRLVTPLTMSAVEEVASRIGSAGTVVGTMLFAELDATRAERDALQERLRNVIPIVQMPLDEAKDPVAALIWHKAELAKLRSAAADMAEALGRADTQICDAEKLAIEHAEDYRLAVSAIRSVLSRWSALTGKDATK